MAIAVPLQKPLCDCEPQMLANPSGIAIFIDEKHPGAAIVYHLIEMYPRVVSRQQLRARTGHDGREPRHSAVFEWLILRANDTLPLTGWKIDEDRERYRLARIARKHHERLLEQHR